MPSSPSRDFDSIWCIPLAFFITTCAVLEYWKRYLACCGVLFFALRLSPTFSESHSIVSSLGLSMGFAFVFTGVCINALILIDWIFNTNTNRKECPCRE
jgi:hypothetical protein